MLNIYLFGKLRQLAENKEATSDSIIRVDFHEDEKFSSLLNRIGINEDEIGEIFVNHHLADTSTIIPKDESRIAIFSRGMNLIDGGQHLKGHGLIETRRKKIDYY